MLRHTIFSVGLLAFVSSVCAGEDADLVFKNAVVHTIKTKSLSHESRCKCCSVYQSSIIPAYNVLCVPIPRPPCY